MFDRDPFVEELVKRLRNLIDCLDLPGRTAYLSQLFKG